MNKTKNCKLALKPIKKNPMRKIRAILVDDETDALEILSNLLNNTGQVEIISQISNPLKVESAINKLKPDILFLDIEMPILNGLELLENIREYNYDLTVVFITAHGKYVNEAIKLNVYTYLQKPIDRFELIFLINKLYYAKEHQAKNTFSQKIKLPITDGYVYLKPTELFFLEAEGNYTRIKTTSGEEFISSYNMGRLFERLPSYCYYRINRNCILNGEYIFKINKKQGICQAKVHDKTFDFEVSKSFLSSFNKAAN